MLLALILILVILFAIKPKRRGNEKNKGVINGTKKKLNLVEPKRRKQALENLIELYTKFDIPITYDYRTIDILPDMSLNFIGGGIPMTIKLNEENSKIISRSFDWVDKEPTSRFLSFGYQYIKLSKNTIWYMKHIEQFEIDEFIKSTLR